MNGFRRSIAVILGINKYTNHIPSLRTAVNDAVKLAEILETQHHYEVFLRLDEDVTREKIMRLLMEELPSEVTPDARVLFYFAGHGVALDDVDGRPAGFLIPQDARPESRDTFLSMPVLHDALLALPCRHLLTILDCCFAGAFRWSSTRDLQPLPEIIYKERYERFIDDPAWQVITSAAHNQQALDEIAGQNLGRRGDGLNHSPFARALFDALGGAGDLAPPAKPGQPSGDGVITASELYIYLRDSVEPSSEAFAVRQTPGIWPLRKHDRGEYIFLVPGHPLNLPPAPALTAYNNPYRGFEPFAEAHHDLFFGRDAMIDGLVAKVGAQPLTTVVGSARSGKSSLIRAGLIPRLRDETEGGWSIESLPEPLSSPFEALANLTSTDSFRGLRTLTPQDLRSDSRALSNIVNEWQAANRGAKLLLFIDDFDLLLSECKPEESVQQFLELLAKALAAHPQTFRLVVTVDSGYERNFAETALRIWWEDSLHQVVQMTREDFRQAVEGPASVRVFYFEPPGLIEDLIEDVYGERGALPLLSRALCELYMKYFERRSDDRSLVREDYEAMGRIAGLVAGLAQQLFDDLDDAHRTTMKNVLLRLVVSDGGTFSGRRVPLDELEFSDAGENERVSEIIRRLSLERLVLIGARTGPAPYCELAHDCLVDGWAVMRAWCEAEREAIGLRQRLGQAHNDWREGGRDALRLWEDEPRLTRAVQTLRAGSGWLNRDESDFVLKSAERRAKNRRKRRLINVTAVALLLTVCVVTLFSTRRYLSSRLERTSAYYLNAINSARSNDPLRALLLASAAIDESPPFDRSRHLYDLSAYYFGHRAPLSVTNLPIQVSKSTRFSRNHEKVLTRLPNDTLAVWTIATGEPGPELRLESGAEYTVAQDGNTDIEAELSPDGNWAAALIKVNKQSADGKRERSLRLQVWAVKTGDMALAIPADYFLRERTETEAESPAFQAGFDFSADSRTLLIYDFTSSAGERVQVWELERGVQYQHEQPIVAERIVTPRPHGHLSPNPARNWMIVSRKHGEIEVLSVETGRAPAGRSQPMRLPGEGVLMYAGFTSDAAQVVTVTMTRRDPKKLEYRLWNAASGEPLTSSIVINPDQGSGSFEMQCISPDGRRLLLEKLTNPTALVVWDRENPTGGKLINHHQSTNHNFEPVFLDGRRVLLLTQSGVLQVWDVESPYPHISFTPTTPPPDSAFFSLSNDAKTLMTTNRNGTIYQWALMTDPAESLVPAGSMFAEKSRFHDAVFTPDRENLLTITTPSEGDVPAIQLWNLKTGNPSWPEAIPTLSDYPPEVKFSADGKFFFTLARDIHQEQPDYFRKRVEVRDVASSSLLYDFSFEYDRRGTTAPAAAAFNRDASRIYTAFVKDNSLRVQEWEKTVVDGPRRQPPPAGTSVEHAADKNIFLGFSRDGEHYLVGTDGAELNFRECAIWSVAERRQISGLLKVTDENSARLLRAVFRQSGEVTAKSVSEFTGVIGGGRRVLMSFSNGNLQVTNLTTGQAIRHPQGATGGTDRHLSPDGKWILIDMENESPMQLWDTANGKYMTMMMWHEKARPSFAFTDDGERLLTATSGGRIRSWRLTLQADKPWLAHMGTALSGMQFDANDTIRLTPQRELMKAREAFATVLRRSAASGDKQAQSLMTHFQWDKP